jgi:hypothetical protein
LACRPGAPRSVGRCRVPAELGLESGPGSGKKTAPTGRVRLSASDGGGEKEAGCVGELGQGEGEASHAVEGERRKGRASWAMREKRKMSAWVGPQGRKERGKKKRESGPDPIRKRGRKRIAFKCI